MRPDPRAFVLLLLAISLPCPAAVFDIPDGDVDALVAAIQTSNANGETDVINLAAGGDYVLASNQNPGSATGLPAIAGELVINGNGATLRRSGQAGTPDMRVLITTATAQLTLNDLTIRDGFTTGFGGGINNLGALTLNNCMVTANSGGQGGGIHNTGVLETNGGEISDNIGTGGNGGGGIYSQGANADVTLTGTLMSGNTTVGAGGAIRNQTSGSGTGGFFTIVDSIIERNSAIGINGHGGAIEDSGRMSISGSTIRHNTTSGDGGGIRSSNGSGRFLTITDSAIHDNAAGANGGGLRMSFSDINLSGLQVHDNSATNGAGIYIATTSSDHLVNLSDCSLQGNEASGDGGGIFNGRATVNISRCRIADNVAGGRGGGLLNSNVATLTLTDSTVDGNTATLDGGGAYTATFLVLERSTVSNNTSETGHGGGIMNTQVGARVWAVNSTISGNVAGGEDSAGGGLHNTRPGSDIIKLSLVTVTGNQAATAGGIYNDPDSAFRRSVELDNAIVAGNDGGDINDFFDDLGYNLIGDGTGITATTSFMANPRLGALADNGGPTPTHALNLDSPAIGAGDCVGGTIGEDQRGIPRPQLGACDIGSFEFIDLDRIFHDRFELGLAGGTSWIRDYRLPLPPAPP